MQSHHHLPLFLLCFILISQTTSSLIPPKTITATHKDEISCTMCSACENPCQQPPSPPPPSPSPPPPQSDPTTNCPPPPSQPSSGTNYYSPPPPKYIYSSPPPPGTAIGGLVNPPPFSIYPGPPPPNPIVPYFPFYYHTPPPAMSNALQFNYNNPIVASSLIIATTLVFLIFI
ncbi:hypothetical protein GIB67_022984 [Kingdonia uniflora]|uniref:Uncharacterized protein n=1 Tax=Kingdonia uniflora TaxID=39325 RepID=A0A7J7P2G7_9MAGN|nr:hypothetical protein GIB67_022984 [Kingdonia uniflora]